MSAENGHACGRDAAAYVLGALDPPEIDAFRRHIAECAACREEVAAYEQVVEALPAPGSERYEVPKDLRRRVMREVRATPKAAGAMTTVRAPRSWRPLVALAGALAVLVIAVIVVAGVNGGGSGVRTVEATVTGIPGSAELAINNNHAALIARGLPQLPAGRVYEMWVQRSGPPEYTGALFSVSKIGFAAVGVPQALNGVRYVMVTTEPAGGTVVPTSAPIIVARVS